jgi:hypothetical protein
MEKINEPLRKALEMAQVIREPVGWEKGYWVGAPGVFYAADEQAYYLTYRIRRPRGVAPDRGGEAKIARSTDLKNFVDVWTVNKDQYHTASIERSAIRKGADGVFRYWTSYVDAKDGRWCVAVIKGRDVAKFDAAKVERVFSASPLGLEGIKDPWVCEENGMFYLFLSVAIATPQTGKKSHETLDIYNTGECLSATGLVVSHDLDNWEWRGLVMTPPATGWDKYCQRINSVVKRDGKYLAFYDGSASAAENYEERTGLAIGTSLKSWQSLTVYGPGFTSPHTSHSLRYIDAQVMGEEVLVFFEYARADGAHDLRLARTSVDALPMG